MPYAKQQQEYVTQRVQTASPLELIRILYEAALQSVEEAVQALQAGDILQRGKAVTKTIGILSELQISLRYDVQKEYCSTLAGLYSYMQSQLIRAHSEQSESPLLEVSRLLHTLLDGWTGAMENLADGSAASPPEPAAAIPAPDPYATAPATSESNPYSTVGAGSLGRTWQL